MVFGSYLFMKRILANTCTYMRRYLSSAGATAHSDATRGSFEMLKWNDTNAYSARVEAKLGGFNISLPNKTLELYNAKSGEDNYIAYASMISDIRTVCPLQELANTASR